MTLDELAAWPKATVGSKEAAQILGCDRYSLNIAAKQGTLNAEYFFSGNRLHISKAWLLHFCGYPGYEHYTRTDDRRGLFGRMKEAV